MLGLHLLVIANTPIITMNRYLVAGASVVAITDLEIGSIRQETLRIVRGNKLFIPNIGTMATNIHTHFRYINSFFYNHKLLSKKI